MAQPSHTAPWKAHLALWGVGLIYAYNYLVAKGLMPEKVGPSGFIALRVAGATPLFWLLYAFRWERDGRVVEGARVAAEELVGKETWTCTATASDGRADGPPGTASVYVEAAPIPYFTLEDRNPTSPRYGRAVSPRDYLEKVSGWYFTHAT